MSDTLNIGIGFESYDPTIIDLSAVTLDFELISGGMVLVSPVDLATGVSINGPITWEPLAGWLYYQLQIATDAGFVTIVDTVITTATSRAVNLSNNTTYYWRVRPANVVIPQDEQAVTGVSVVPSTANIAPSGTVQLTANVTATGGASTAVTWSSSNEAVLTVNSTGLVTAVGSLTQSATITATSVFNPAQSGSSTVTISEVITYQTSRAGDEAALQDFYTASAGASWATNTGWAASGMSLDNAIHGVTTNGLSGTARRVTSINLRDNNLVGTLPNSLGNLNEITYFNVKQNDLGGALPVGIGQWTKCTNLLLNGDSRDTLSQLVDIHPLYPPATSASNKFTGVLPPEWGNCAAMQFLQLRGFDDGQNTNSLSTTLPPEWSGMTDIRGLYLDGQNITGQLPPEWSTMTQIRQLNLAWTRMNTTLPPEYSSWVNCRSFRMRNGTIIGQIPSEWSTLLSLRTLDLRSTKISGSIPAWMLDGSAPMSNFVITFGQITGTIPPITTTGIQVFEVSYNRELTGSLPSGIAFCNNMQIINTQGCNLTGPLPAEGWTGYNRLRNLQINGGNHAGPLPPNLLNNSTTASTNRFELYSCGFTGGIPSEWDNFRSNGVLRLYLQNNSLSGPISAGLSDWRSQSVGTVTGVNTSTNFISHANSYVDGNIVYFESTGTLPAPLTADTKYFVRVRTTSGYEVSETLGGAAVNITTTGSGTITVRRNAWRTDGDGLNISGNDFTEADRAALVAAWPPNVPLIV